MKRSIVGLTFLILIALSSLGAEPDRPKTIQFAAIVSWSSGDNDIKGRFSNIGPGIRLDISPAKWLMISPEVSYLSGGAGGLSLGATVNGKLGPAYVGLGFLSLRQTTAVYFAPQKDSLSAFWKAHVGLKGRHWLIAFSGFFDRLSDPWIYGLGLTAGYIF